VLLGKFLFLLRFRLRRKDGISDNDKRRALSIGRWMLPAGPAPRLESCVINEVHFGIHDHPPAHRKIWPQDHTESRKKTNQTENEDEEFEFKIDPGARFSRNLQPRFRLGPATTAGQILSGSDRARGTEEFAGSFKFV
jgi:hypothetical protein